VHGRKRRIKTISKVAVVVSLSSSFFWLLACVGDYTNIHDTKNPPTQARAMRRYTRQKLSYSTRNGRHVMITIIVEQ
jgi:hypothetical protein